MKKLLFLFLFIPVGLNSQSKKDTAEQLIKFDLFYDVSDTFPHLKSTRNFEMYNEYEFYHFNFKPPFYPLSAREKEIRDIIRDEMMTPDLSVGLFNYNNSLKIYTNVKVEYRTRPFYGTLYDSVYTFLLLINMINADSNFYLLTGDKASTEKFPSLILTSPMGYFYYKGNRYKIDYYGRSID